MVATSPRRHHRRLRLHRGRAAPPARPPPRPRGGLRHRRHAGRHAAADLYPSLAAAYPDLVFETFDPAACDGPRPRVPRPAPRRQHGDGLASCVGTVGCIVDLSADFRLKDAVAVPAVVRLRPRPARAARRGRVRPARAVPRGAGRRDADRHARLLRDRGDARPRAARRRRRDRAAPASSSTPHPGSRGAGRAPKHANSFCTVDEDFTAYGLLNHRHTPEIEQETGAQVLFTPHLAPMNRGILATCYARPADGTVPSTAALLDALRRPYAGEPFVVVAERSPSTKATLGTNTAHLTVRFDERTGCVVAICAIDNLTKGASGGAVQAPTWRSASTRPPGSTAVGLVPVSDAAPCAAERPRRGAAVHPPLRRQGRRRQVRRQRARRLGRAPTTRSPCSPPTSC